MEQEFRNILDQYVGKISQLKGISGFAALNKRDLPDMPTLYFIGSEYYGHVFTPAMIKDIAITGSGLIITLKEAK